MNTGSKRVFTVFLAVALVSITAYVPCAAADSPRVLAAKELMKSGNYDGAIQRLLPLLQQTTEDPYKVVRWLTECYRAKGGNQGALDAIRNLYESHSAIDGCRESVGMKLAELYAKMLKWDEAIAQYLQLASEYPSSPHAHKWEAAKIWKWNKRDPARAEELLREVVQAKPDNEYMRELLVACLYEQRKTVEAEECLRNARSRGMSGDKVLLLKIRALYVGPRDYESAIAVCDEVVSEYPTGPSAATALGLKGRMILIGLRKPKEAQQALQAAAVADPSSAFRADWDYDLAYCDQMMGNWLAARDGYEKVCRTYKTSPLRVQAMYGVGRCCVKLHDYVGARKTWSKLLAEYPGEPIAGAAKEDLARLPQ